MELCTIVISKHLLQLLVDSNALSANDYEVKSVDIKDGLFDNDQHYQKLKKDSIKAYKELKEYEFNVRNKIVK